MKRLFTVPALLLASVAEVLGVPAAAQGATTDVGSSRRTGRARPGPRPS